MSDTNDIQGIPSNEAEPWCLLKHYAKRVPSISYAFGIYVNGVINGVVTYGMAPNYAECEAWKPWQVLELPVPVPS
jgi:hypothetical protein